MPLCFHLSEGMQFFKPVDRDGSFKMEISPSYFTPPHLLMCFFPLFPPVRYLLKNNVSPDLCNEDGLTALHQVTLSNCVSTLLSFFLLDFSDFSLSDDISPLEIGASITNWCLNIW